MRIKKIEWLEERDDTGCIEVEGNHNFAVSAGVFIKNSLLENFYLPQSADGRGSDVTSIGGNSAGFTELQDLYFFQDKLYRALKYPMSRIKASQEGRHADVVFGGQSVGEITRDEIKWAKFLERQQNKFTTELEDLFLLHLEFKGLKKEYELKKGSIKVYMNPPSHYKEDMEQRFHQARYDSYSAMADREEFSRYYLMKKFLKFSDEEIQSNKDGMAKDKELGLRKSEEGGSEY